MDRDLQRMMYNDFFNEMLEIQKEAGWLGTALKGGKRLLNDPTKSMGSLRKAWDVGVRRGAGMGRGVAGPLPGGVGNRLGQAWGGVRNVMKTPEGRALALGAGGAGLAGAGAMGTGYMAGRR